MSSKADTHNPQNKLEDLQNCDNLSEHNTQILQEFTTYLFSEDLSDSRVHRYLQSIERLAETGALDFPLDEAENEDVQKMVAAVNQDVVRKKDGGTYSVWSKAEFRKVIAKFYRWHTGEDQPEIIDFITIKPKKSEQPKTDPAQLLSPQDILDLLKAARNRRDEALIFTLWDTGGRVGEVQELQWRDIKHGDNYAQVRFRESKTGERTVPVRECVPTLKEWQNQHPRGEDPESYVFIGLPDKGQVSYTSVRTMLRDTAERAGVKNPVNPHNFRKSRATYLAAQGMNQAQICEYFGWVQGSDRAATYIRMAEKDVEKALGKIHGLEDNGDEEEQNLLPVTCPECGTLNPAHYEQCRKVDVVEQLQGHRNCSVHRRENRSRKRHRSRC